MGNPDPNPAEPDAAPSARGDLAGRARSAADTTSVLLELARALRGLAAYSDAPLRRRALAERAFHALTADVARAGPLELSVRGETFAVTALADRLDARGGLSVLHGALTRHAIERLRVDAKITVDALQGFLELLLRPAVEEGDDEPRTFVRTLATRDARGLRINDLDLMADSMPRPLAATPLHPSRSVTTPLVSSAPEPAPRAPDPRPTPTSVTAAQSTARSAGPAGAVSPASAAGATLGARLQARLVELEHTVEDDGYGRLAAEIVVWTREVWQAGHREDAYRAMVALADHAVGCGGRPESQARIAAACFAELASGERLENLIDRALASDESGVRAAQLLLQRREAAVAAIVDRICASPDPLETTPLHALVLTSGEVAVATLLRGITGGDETRAKVSLRLAGELQSTALLPVLAETAKSAPIGRQLEAIRALCLVPGEASHQALADALASQLDQIAIAATQAIAANTGIDAVPALLDVLETHVRGSRTQLCRALIDVLGRLGDERAVPRLTAILERRPVLRRAHWHALQLSAVDALAVLPTREARRAVERAASHAAGPVRDRARNRLSILAGIGSGGGAAGSR